MKYIKTAIISIVVIVTVLILLDQSNKIKQEKIDKTNLNATNEKSKVTTSYANEPVITSNGLIPIIYDKDGNSIENFDKKEWYSYKKEDKKWANAITKDQNSNITGYYVWIPRFAYKITYKDPNDKTKEGKIDIKFLIGNSDQYVDDDGKIKNAVHIQTDELNSLNSYVVHPSFISDSKNGYKNGGWSSEIEGFWISKYPATYQQTSLGNELTDEEKNKIIYSNNSYYINEEYTYINDYNVYGEITNKTRISYPTFMPLAYTYTKINIGDATNLTRQIAKNNSLYNLKNIDSHLVKLSEWSAMAYLTQSDYGNGNSKKINNYYILEENDDNSQINRITGLSQELDAEKIFFSDDKLENMNYYNTKEGQKSSSTGNIYGIYDIAGGVNEYLAGYIKNGNKLIEKSGNSNGKYKFYNEESTRYITKYPYNKDNDMIKTNFEEYMKGNYYGDSMKELSNNEMMSWRAYLNYPFRDHPFFCKAGSAFLNGNFGIFAISRTRGDISENYGFRVCLINE